MTEPSSDVLEQLAEAVKWWNADEAEEPDVRRLFAACKAEIERLMGSVVRLDGRDIEEWRDHAKALEVSLSESVTRVEEVAVVAEGLRAVLREKEAYAEAFAAALMEGAPVDCESEEEIGMPAFRVCQTCGGHGEYGGSVEHYAGCIIPKVEAFLAGRPPSEGKPDYSTALEGVVRSLAEACPMTPEVDQTIRYAATLMHPKPLVWRGERVETMMQPPTARAICRDCDGCGWVEGGELKAIGSKCDACGGTGEAPNRENEIGILCPDCGGIGTRMVPFTVDDADACPTCNGLGELPPRSDDPQDTAPAPPCPDCQQGHAVGTKQPTLDEFDKGPWTPGEVGAYVQSEDFEHDARLNISGDFENHDARYAYACALAATLNRRTSQVSKQEADRG